jgi:hypothetical protein
VRLTAPAGGPVAGTLPVATVTSASVVAVRFFLDGLALGPELTSPPFVLDWDTTAIPDGAHVLQARARDAAGVVAVSPGLPVVVGND